MLHLRGIERLALAFFLSPMVMCHDLYASQDFLTLQCLSAKNTKSYFPDGQWTCFGELSVEERCIRMAMIRFLSTLISDASSLIA